VQVDSRLHGFDTPSHLLGGQHGEEEKSESRGEEDREEDEAQGSSQVGDRLLLMSFEPAASCASKSRHDDAGGD
jgi:hypothetical protein